MRPLAEYSLRDWQSFRPLTHGYKAMRYAAGRELYVRRPARGGAADFSARIAGQRVLASIAFNDVEAIAMQAEAIARFVRNALYIIADNSTDDDAAGAIAAIAAKRALPYVRLPGHRWRKPEQASRAHGHALNWVWRNVMLPGRPEAFGFLDHDLFPTAPDDPFAMLARQPVYGVLRQSGSRWFLWAGFCLFRFNAVKDLPLDFAQAWFVGLDTGGGNWSALYRRLDRNGLTFMPTRFEPFRPGADPVHDTIQWCGVWLHEVGQTQRAGRLEEAAEKRCAVKQLIAAPLEASGAS
jgi:hypothetical protein